MDSAPRTQCSPNEADWHVSMVIGKTFCYSHGTMCRRDTCERESGTATSEFDAWFKGERPTVKDRNALVPEGWYRLESEVRLCR